MSRGQPHLHFSEKRVLETRTMVDLIRQASSNAKRPMLRPEDEIGVLWDWSRQADARPEPLVLAEAKQREDA